MRTEEQLREALSALAHRAPRADQFAPKLQLAPMHDRPNGPRRALPVLAVCLALVVAGAILLPRLIDRQPLPENGRVPGNWAMTSRFDPPSGWTLGSREIGGSYEISGGSDSTGKGSCRFEVNGVGVDPKTLVPPAGERVEVNGRPAIFVPQDHEMSIFWLYQDDAWASVNCWLGPYDRLAGEGTPERLRTLIISLAERVRFGTFPVLLPVRINELPDGYRVYSVSEDENPRFLTNWHVSIGPDAADPGMPAISIHAALGDPGPLNARVGRFPASFETYPIRGPMTTTPRPFQTYSSLCMHTAPVGTCLQIQNPADVDPDSRKPLLISIAEKISFAASATDTSTWFDARDAVPG